MSDKPKIGIPEDAAYVRFGDLLQELPRRVAEVLIDASDSLAEVGRPVTIKAWRTALIEAAERGELKGSMLVAGALHGGMGERVTSSSIKSFLEARGFEVVMTRPEHRGEAQSRIKQTRRDDLSAVIADASERAADPTHTASVWLALRQMEEDKVPPLIGFADGEIKYTGSDGEVGALSKRALAARLDRERKKTGR
jgi:hypothetical protein